MAVCLNVKQKISHVYENAKHTAKQDTHSEVDEHDYEEIDISPVPIPVTLQDLKIQERRRVTTKWKIATLISVTICIGLTLGVIAMLVFWLLARVEVSSSSEGRCLNNGTFSVVEDEAVCTCVKGFYGKRCEMTPCSDSSCQNEGTCFIHQLQSRCACKNGFMGWNCEKSLCSIEPCVNGGICNMTIVHDRPQIQCTCPAEFSGPRCEVKFSNQQDCSDLNSTEHKSGVYLIQPKGSKRFHVYCNMDTDGGGWTVFQKRFNGETDFFRGWNDYKEGFGNPKEEYWLGNAKLSFMTSQTQYELRIYLEDFQGTTAFAKYSNFSIGDESTDYKLTTGGHSGTAGDSMGYHNNMTFSTKDRYNDKSSQHCADVYKGAWWYDSCYHSNLNGRYLGNKLDATGICWNSWRGNNQSLKKTSMMIRKKYHN